MEINILQVPAQITKITTLVDGGLNLTINTPELVPEDITTMMGLKNKLGYFVFKPERIIESDILSLPEEPVEKFTKNKSPSERLYNVLFVYWRQQGSKGEFEDYYKSTMEKFITSIKEKLNDD